MGKVGIGVSVGSSVGNVVSVDMGVDVSISIEDSVFVDVGAGAGVLVSVVVGVLAGVGVDDGEQPVITNTTTNSVNGSNKLIFFILFPFATEDFMGGLLPFATLSSMPPMPANPFADRNNPIFCRDIRYRPYSNYIPENSAWGDQKSAIRTEEAYMD
ncbi:MAG: hypothetical protein KJ638_00025 [Chloroflexi bacterium]|nr:hypothetical protein [Chloroflexota bacterium]